jgi:hypothetical protein
MNTLLLSMRLDALCCNDLLLMARSKRRRSHPGSRLLVMSLADAGELKSKNKNRFWRVINSTLSEDKLTTG